MGVTELLNRLGSPQERNEMVGIERERPCDLCCVLDPLLVARTPAEGELANSSRRAGEGFLGGLVGKCLPPSLD
jgi:hypothetical protein